MTATSPPRVQTEAFTGPIDLLVDEVRRQNVAVEQIAMAPLVARFLEYVRSAAERNLNLNIDWLHMAATLIQWKSRSLLPRDARENAAGPDPVRDDLVELLRSHRRDAAQQLAEQKRVAESRLSRPPDPLFTCAREPEEPADPPFVSVWDLIGLARDLAHWTIEYRSTEAHWNTGFDLTPAPVSTAQMMDALREFLRGCSSFPVDALPFLLGQPTPAHRACLFLGLLELVRDQEITVDQAAESDFSDSSGGVAVEGIWLALNDVQA